MKKHSWFSNKIDFIPKFQYGKGKVVTKIILG